MSLLTKIRGLYRFDGDTDPVLVSRRSFLFMGGVMAAGAVVPAVFGAPGIEVSLAAFWRSADPNAAALFKERYRHVIPALYQGMPYHWDRTGESWMNLERVDVRAMTIPRRIG